MVDGEIVIHAGIVVAKYVSPFTVPIPNARQLESESMKRAATIPSFE